MTKRRQILVGPSVDRPVIALSESKAWAEFRKGSVIDKDSSAIGRVLGALQAVPDLLLAGSVAGKRLMEVEIHGDLVRAGDGVGYRAFAIGGDGIKEHARLFDVEHLTSMVNVAALWHLASAVVGQKFLHDINENLKEIKSVVVAIGSFQRDEQRSKIESSYEYLFQIEKSLADGELSSAVRHRLEHIEADMDAIERHLQKLFEAKLGTPVVDDEMFGVDKLTKDLASKAEEVDGIIQDSMLAGMTRLGALQMLAMYPGEATLKRARAQSIRKSIQATSKMPEDFGKSMAAEIDAMDTKWEAAITLMSEASPLHKFVLEAIQLPKRMQSNVQPKSFRGPDGSLTPKLDETKKALKAKLVKSAEAASERARGMAVSCDRIEHLLNGRPLRYLVEWGDGAPLKIREASKHS